MSVHELTTLVPPLESPLATSDLHDGIGLSLPADYLEVVRRYGHGTFDNFIWLLLPSENPNLDLTTQTDRQRKALRQFQEAGGQIPYPPDELTPWAITDNGDVFYWRQDATDPDRWSVILGSSRGSDWEEFNGTMTESLVATLKGRFGRAILSADFPSPAPRFRQVV